MNNEERNYNLLRPFDLEAAKRGEKICSLFGEDADFIGMKLDGRVVFEVDSLICDCLICMLRMLPLCWLQGKPLYKGDTVYFTEDGSEHVAESFNGEYIVCNQGLNEFVIHPDYASWDKPKIKKQYWVNLYKDESYTYDLIGQAHSSKELADRLADDDRVACVAIELEA